MYLIKVVTFSVGEGTRMDEIHERDSVDYLVKKTVAVFTGMALQIGILGERERERERGREREKREKEREGERERPFVGIERDKSLGNIRTLLKVNEGVG